MLWGKTFNPRDYLTPPTPFTVGQPKPETVPADIAAAIEDLMIAAEDMGASYDAKGFPSPEREEIAGMYRSALNVTILKHLRGEA